MRLTIECEPKEFACFVSEFQKMLTENHINPNGTKENTDNAVIEQCRQRFNKTESPKIAETVSNCIKEVLTRYSGEANHDTVSEDQM